MISSAPSNQERKQYAANIILAIVAGQVGCFTLLIVLAAVLAGLFVDSRLQTRPIFTVVLLLISVPVSLAMMFFIVRGAVGRIKTQNSAAKTQREEVAQIGRSKDE